MRKKERNQKIKDLSRFITEGPKFGADDLNYKDMTVEQIEKEFERQARIWLDWRLRPLVTELAEN